MNGYKIVLLKAIFMLYRLPESERVCSGICTSDDVVIAGVCAGVADYLGLPSGKVRLATLLLVLVGGLSIWVYILLWIVVPKGPKRLEGNSR